MSSGSGKSLLIIRLTLVLVLPAIASGCWIPLPEETAIVVEVFDALGAPVDGVRLILDGAETIVTGSQRDAGQVFKSLSVEGDHTLQLDTGSLIDPQGGIGWVPLASQISGEVVPLSFGNRPFAGGSDVLIVPVSKGLITVATIYLDDILKSPMDNQWLTDGANASPYRTQNNVDEFRNNPEPTFWWRQDPSLGQTVVFTFQLWEDDDGDTRYPLGIVDHPQYTSAMNPGNAAYVQPDWQIPLAGIQRAETAAVNQIVLLSSEANDPFVPIDYDLYYAPTSQWNNANWERNPVLRDMVFQVDGTARRFAVGTGTANSGIVLKNGTEYTFAIKARDGASNLDTTTGVTSTRRATPTGTASLGSVTNLAAVADSVNGGRIDLFFNCSVNQDLRVYAAPYADFSARPYDTRFIRDTLFCLSGTNNHTLDKLVNGVSYAVGLEPFDANGNVGTASSIAEATPSSASAPDTTDPVFSGAGITATPNINGRVILSIDAVSDASTVYRRVYWSPTAFTSNEEAMSFTDLPAATSGSAAVLTITDIPNDIPHNYIVNAIDFFGNSARATATLTLSEPDTTGPTWASDDPAFYATIVYAPGSTTNVWDLGATWNYRGFALGLDPGQGQGEYVWRVIQENPDRGVSVETKLGAFYTYSGYFYASTDSGSLNMSSPSSNADHRDVFSFIEGASNVLSADVLGTPFDSTISTGYRQRTTAQYSASLAAGSGTTNQLTILYNTNEDGEAVVSQIISPTPGFAGILRVFSVRKQTTPLPTPEPHLQGKEFQLSYFDTDYGLLNFPPPTFGGSGIFFNTTLDEPDYQDPRW